MVNLRRLIDFYVFGRHRLQTVKMVALGCSIKNVIEVYGEAVEEGPSDESPEITKYTFLAGPYHQAVVCEWKQTIHSIIYCSAKADPARDLQCTLDRYKEDSRWEVMEEGYWYQREDGKVRIWCSAIPVIGVAYVEFLAARAEYKKANSLKQLRDLEDVRWAPDVAIFQLQRQFVEGQSAGLADFASQSDKIAVSPDGRYVFVVREHHAYDVKDGFMELNEPPQKEGGGSTQVINCFTRSQGASMWSKTTLPRDANVDRIRFEGDQCHLRIRQTGADRVLTFRGPAASIARLSRISICAGAYDDTELWKRLEEEAQLSAGANGPPPSAPP
jgi:hypothetical protein